MKAKAQRGLIVFVSGGEAVQAAAGDVVMLPLPDGSPLPGGFVSVSGRAKATVAEAGQPDPVEVSEPPQDDSAGSKENDEGNGER